MGDKGSNPFAQANGLPVPFYTQAMHKERPNLLACDR